tara:strand:+ start:520 stop:888 length:369 start_codon:yes stop_codon:yes gene_type:complete
MIEKKSLSIFGFIWSGIIAFFSVKHNINFLKFVSLSFIMCSLFFPEIFLKTYIYQGWVKFGNLIGNLNSKLIILILFFFVFTPMGFFLKLFGKTFLLKQIDKKKKSYLINRKIQPGSMINQF